MADVNVKYEVVSPWSYESKLFLQLHAFSLVLVLMYRHLSPDVPAVFKVRVFTYK